MLIWVMFKMALRSLMTHKLRTFLTALGIIIGVASVISMYKHHHHKARTKEIPACDNG